jgi:hypothetical protein
MKNTDEPLEFYSQTQNSPMQTARILLANIKCDKSGLKGALILPVKRNNTPKLLSEVVKTLPTDFMMNTTQTTPKPNNRQLSAPRGKFHAEDWLPLPDEWDFRSVAAEECRFACFWEYFRSIRSINTARASDVVCWVKGKNGRPGKGAELKTGNYLCSRAGDLSRPYVTIDRIVYKKFSDRIAECDSERSNHALIPLLHICRDGGWLTAGDAITADRKADEVRRRTWSFFSKLLFAAQKALQIHRDALEPLYRRGLKKTEEAKQISEKMNRALHLVDSIATELFFASGAFAEKSTKDKGDLTWPQLTRFWKESTPLFESLVTEPHPHTVHQIIQTFYHLLSCAPSEVFLLATKSIRNSAKEARFQYESLAVTARFGPLRPRVAVAVE